MTTTSTPKPSKPAARKRILARFSKRSWRFYVLVGLAGPMLLFAGVGGYYWVIFSRMIDARMHGEG